MKSPSFVHVLAVASYSHQSPYRVRPCPPPKRIVRRAVRSNVREWPDLGSGDGVGARPDHVFAAESYTQVTKVPFTESRPPMTCPATEESYTIGVLSSGRGRGGGGLRRVQVPATTSYFHRAIREEPSGPSYREAACATGSYEEPALHRAGRLDCLVTV